MVGLAHAGVERNLIEIDTDVCAHGLIIALRPQLGGKWERGAEEKSAVEHRAPQTMDEVHCEVRILPRSYAKKLVRMSPKGLICCGAVSQIAELHSVI